MHSLASSTLGSPRFNPSSADSFALTHRFIIVRKTLNPFEPAFHPHLKRANSLYWLCARSGYIFCLSLSCFTNGKKGGIVLIFLLVVQLDVRSDVCVECVSERKKSCFHVRKNMTSSTFANYILIDDKRCDFFIHLVMSMSILRTRHNTISILNLCGVHY